MKIVLIGVSVLAVVIGTSGAARAQYVPAPAPQPYQPAPTYRPAPPYQPYQPAPAYRPGYAQPGYAYAAAPPSGLGLIIGGSILTGVGLISLATAPACASFYNEASGNRGGCYASTVIVGLVGLGIGVPLLVIGAIRQARFNRWAHGGGYALLEGLTPTAGPGGGGMSWRYAW